MQRSSKPTRCAPDDGASAIARQAARSAFVYFDASRSSPTFMENAGGSQVRQLTMALLSQGPRGCACARKHAPA